MNPSPAGEYEDRFKSLEEKLRPIAKRKVIDKAALARRQHPLDEAGVRPQAESLLADVTGAYISGSEWDREALRDLFQKHTSVSWAIRPPLAPTSEEGFRSWLLMISMVDQGADTRDTILLVSKITRSAAGAGVNIGPIIEEIAGISSDENRYGMGSVRSILLSAQRRMG